MDVTTLTWIVALAGLLLMGLLASLRVLEMTYRFVRLLD